MNRTLIILVFSVAAATAATAQIPPPAAKGKTAVAAPPALPTVEQVLDRYVQAIGGQAAVSRVNSRLARGSVELPAMGANGAVEVYTKAPNKILTIVNLPSVGVVQNGFNGAVGWEQNPRAGIREVSGAELAALKLDAEFYAGIKLRELYPGMTLKRARVGERDTYMIEATPMSGGAKKLYFDTQSGLLVRVDAERENPQGKFVTETYMDDYKEVDGVKLPFTVRQVLPGLTLIFRFNEIKNNVPIDDSKFNKPTG